MHRFARQAGWLLLLTAGLWLLAAYPAYALAGRRGLEGLSWSALLCVVPGLLVVWASSFQSQVTADFRLWLFLGGMLLRMMFVLGGALVFSVFRPDMQLLEFFVWLVLFYIATLVAETWTTLIPAGPCR